MVKKAETSETKVESTIPKSEVEKMLAQQREAIIAELTGKIKDEIKANVVDTERAKSIDKSDIPDDDMLDKPKYYYAWGTGVTFDAYREKGRDIKAPYNRPIRLKRLPPIVEIDSLGERKELNWCSAEIWSQKEVDYIEGSPLFHAGIIMCDANGLKYEEAQMTNLRIQAVASVSKMTKNELINHCRGRQIKGLDNDFIGMRNKLIESMCKDFSGDMRKTAENIAANNQKANEELLK